MKSFVQDIPNLSEDVVENARAAAQRLEGLWPLTDAHQLDNDVHYGDNLQVRQTYQIAKILLGMESPEAQDVTIADAEYVFEGAEDIPGRDQILVDALLAANDAYEQALELENDFTALQILQVAACVSGDSAVSADLGAVEQIIDTYVDDNAEDTDDDAEHLIRAFMLGREVSQLIEDQSDDEVPAAALMILVANGYLDYVASPRTYMKAAQLVDVYHNGVENSAVDILETAAHQWNYHHDEILWDKNEAQRKAKEEDEAKSKAALAAKFAHVKDDPNKPEVEL